MHLCIGNPIMAVFGAMLGLGAGVGIGCAVYNFNKSSDSTNEEGQAPPPCRTDACVTNDSVNMAAGQVDAVVVDAVNANRIYCLKLEMDSINRNNAGADEQIRLLKEQISKLLNSNRGGPKGIHGFIGEAAQVRIANVKAFIINDEPLYILLDDNSMTDYVRGFQLIQQKACKAGGNLGLDAIKQHSEKYPEFVAGGGIYQIPKDMFDDYSYLKNLPENSATKLRNERYRRWKKIKDFSEENPEIIIEPMEVSYQDIQAGNIESTIKRVEDETDKEFNKQRQAAQEKYAPSLKEFCETCGLSAAIEGGTEAGIEFISKLKIRKKLSEFTKQDWIDIASNLFVGSGKGTVRGGLLYIGTNVFKIPAAVISGVITALFGLAHEGYLLFKKKISKREFAIDAPSIVLEAATTTAGAMAGRRMCKKCPVLGAIIGSNIGSIGIRCVRNKVFA